MHYETHNWKKPEASNDGDAFVRGVCGASGGRGQEPFKGAVQGYDTAHSPGGSPGVVVLTTSVTGIGTIIGQLSLTQECTINLTVGTETCSAHWTAANGDGFDTAIGGGAVPTDLPGIISITELHHIISGTGQFAGATGSFTLHRLHIAATSFTSGSFSGSITFPKETRDDR